MINTSYHQRATRAGFTLLELLVVMAIIAVLSGVGLTSVTNQSDRARDANRKRDLNNIAAALEAYYNDFGQYPTHDTVLNKFVIMGNGCAEGIGAPPNVPEECNWGREWATDTGTLYMPKLPLEPGGGAYMYYSTDGSTYMLFARLDNEKDISEGVALDADGIGGAGGPIQTTYTATNCAATGSTECNYAVRSPNLTQSALELVFSPVDL